MTSLALPSPSQPLRTCPDCRVWEVIETDNYCGQCGRGCITASNYSSSNVQILPALEAGKLELITGAMAREIVVDDQARVTAVSYVDKATRTEQQIRCRSVVVAASACESARLPT